MTRQRTAALGFFLVLLTLVLAPPATSQAPQASQTPKSGGVLNMMLREDLAQGFAIHETATISTVWPAMPCLNNLVLFDPLKKTESEDTIIGDRKSTRLNSSHITISYAVFCLKKKNKNT